MFIPAVPGERFKLLLEEAAVAPKESILHYLAIYYAPQVAAVMSSASARDLYDRAARLPHTQTRLALDISSGIIFDGPFSAATTRSTFIYAVEEGAPRVFKIPADPEAAAAEQEAWKAASEQPGAECLAGPVQCITVTSSHRQGQSFKGLLMPIYTMTMQQVCVL